jgi:hypothetical protein
MIRIQSHAGQHTYNTQVFADQTLYIKYKRVLHSRGEKTAPETRHYTREGHQYMIRGCKTTKQERSWICPSLSFTNNYDDC